MMAETWEKAIPTQREASLPETDIPTVRKLSFEQRVAMLIPRDCLPCVQKKRQILHENAFMWGLRWDEQEDGEDAAAALLEERVQCTHDISDKGINISDEAIVGRIAARIATPSLVDIELP